MYEFVIVIISIKATTFLINQTKNLDFFNDNIYNNIRHFFLEETNMDIKNYTEFNTNSIYDFDDEGTSGAVDYLNNPDNFRTFKEGLTEIITEKNYLPENASCCNEAGWKTLLRGSRSNIL